MFSRIPEYESTPLRAIQKSISAADIGKKTVKTEKTTETVRTVKADKRMKTGTGYAPDGKNRIILLYKMGIHGRNGLLEQEADLAIVVGGYNSSNTSHLVELCEEKLPTYFINDASKIISADILFLSA